MIESEVIVMSSDEIESLDEKNSNKINDNKIKSKIKNNHKKNYEDKINKILFCTAEELENIFENHGLLLYNLTKEHSKEHSFDYREKMIQDCYYCFEKGQKKIVFFCNIILFLFEFDDSYFTCLFYFLIIFCDFFFFLLRFDTLSL